MNFYDGEVVHGGGGAIYDNDGNMNVMVVVTAKMYGERW